LAPDKEGLGSADSGRGARPKMPLTASSVWLTPCAAQPRSAPGMTLVRRPVACRPVRRLALVAAAVTGLLAGTQGAWRHDEHPRSGPCRLFVSPAPRGLSEAPRPQQPAACEGAKEPAGASAPASAANLAKNIIGAGVLALPAGAAQLIGEAQSDGIDPSVAVAALVLLFCVFGALNAFGFYLVGEVCAWTGARSYQSAWSRTMGEDLAWVPSMASLICCLMGTVACTSLIGDTARDLVAAATGTALGAWGSDFLLWGLSGGVLLPLCLLPSLGPLAFASLLGLAGVCLLAAVMVVWCVNSSYMPGGELNSAVGMPVAAEGGASLTGLLGRCLLFMAVHAIAIYEELQAPANGDGRQGKLASFRRVTSWAFGLSGALFLLVTLVGVQTFGAVVQKLVLNNYAGVDHLAIVVRAGLCLCVLFEFPLLERCFRHTAAELLELPHTAAGHPLAVAASVALATALACAPGLGLDKVSAFGGAWALSCSSTWRRPSWP